MENLLIYGSIFDTLDELSNEEAGLLFKALNSFRKGEEVEFEDRYLKGLWKGIKPNLDKLKENYDSKVKANQENGKKGGRPPKNNNAVELSKPTTKTNTPESIPLSKTIEEKKYDLITLLKDYITVDDIDGVDKIKDYMTRSLTTSFFTIKQVKNGIDLVTRDEVVTEELVNKLKNIIITIEKEK
jgi:hypothetical protein